MGKGTTLVCNKANNNFLMSAIYAIRTSAYVDLTILIVK